MAICTVCTCTFKNINKLKRVSEGSGVHFSAHHTSYYVEGMGECAKVRGLNVPLKKSRQISPLTKRNI